MTLGLVTIYSTKEHFMKKKQIKFLKQLLETPSPTGFEEPVAARVRERLAPVADDSSQALLMRYKPTPWARCRRCWKAPPKMRRR